MRPALLALLLVACGDAVDGDARDLGLYSATTLADPRDEALAALARDARRREARFREAAEPGWLLAASSPDARAIEAGRYDAPTLFAIGAQLFHHAFTEDEGLGGADAPFPRRLAVGGRGGPEARACADCHARGGPAGAGDAADHAYLQGDGDAPAAGLERNPPSLAGAGWVELLAREMSDDLADQRAALARTARRTRSDAEGALSTHGVGFGTLVVHPDGTVDASRVLGVSADLVVRPFGRKGTFATLREAVEDEAATHLGLQASTWVRELASVPAIVGPHGGDDPDGDGVVDELTEGRVAALALYALLQPVPVVEPPRTPLVPVDGWAEGRLAFERIGCATCHVPALVARASRHVLPSRVGGKPLVVDLAASGAMPALAPDAATGAWSVPLLSDLRRHDLGDALADDRDDRGVGARLFLTPPLWGVASSGPWLHDGRAPTLHDAILAHDGEAKAARDAYVALGEAGQAPIRVFLVSQTRAPVLVAD